MSQQPIELSTLLPSTEKLLTQEKYLNAIRQTPINQEALIGYVGAYGSGKSWVLCRAAIGLAIAYPGIRILIGRKQLTDLKTTTMTTFFSLIGQMEEKLRALYPEDQRNLVPGIGEYHKGDQEYTFFNKSWIKFGPMEDAEERYKSLEVACIGVDESSELTVEAVQTLIGRRRQVGYPLILFLVSNPTSKMHWMYKWLEEKPASTTVYFQTRTSENPFLPPNYEKELRKHYPSDWQHRYLDGQWGGIDEGVPVFYGFNVKTHVKKSKYYPGRPVWVGIDFGYHTPGAVWIQTDRNYRAQIMREWLPKERDPDQLATGILKRNSIWFPETANFGYFCGHDGQQKDSNGKTNIDVFSTYGMVPNFRYHHIERGFTVIRNLIALRDDGQPGLSVDPYCVTVIDSFLGEYRYKKDNDEKVEKTGIYDPVMDAARYVLYQMFTLSGESPATLKEVPIFNHDTPSLSNRSHVSIGGTSAGWRTAETNFTRPKYVRDRD